MRISLCIPMYNELPVAADTARALHEYMSSHFSDGDWEVVFADDGSTDGCADAVRALALDGIRVVAHEKNRGKGAAVRTAMLASAGDIAMFTDCDLAYGTDVISRIVGRFSEVPDAGMVIGSRNLTSDGYEGYTAMRKIASKAYIKVLCMAGGFKLSDSQCGCKAYRREAVRAIFPRCEVDGWAFDFESILWANKLGIKIAEMPVKVINHGESKVHMIKDTLKMLSDLRKMRKRIKNAQI